MHLRRVGLDGRQVADRDAPVGLFDLHFQVRQDVGHDGVEIDPAERADLGRHARIGQQVGDEPRHAGRRILHPIQVIVPGLVYLVVIIFLHQVGEGADLTQGLLQVVRGDVGKVLQFAVALFELGVDAGEFLLGLFALGDVAHLE